MYKVYIVDDAALVRKELVLTTPWETLDCMVVGQAEDGVKAYEEILNLKPDIIITDIKMSIMGGLELIHKLKAQGFCAEFIVISGYSEFEYAFSAIKLEVLDYILKPISDEELMNTLRKTIKRIKAKENQQESGERPGYEDLMGGFDSKNINTHLRKAITYIQEHSSSEISLKEVSQALFISESYLAKLFKTEINTTFVEFVTQVRIKYSLELLKDGQMPIYEIAQKVGYKDYRYFSMVFKKMIGITPKEFQKKS